MEFRCYALEQLKLVKHSNVKDIDNIFNTKQVYEKGFGATLGIYDTATDTYSTGCSVTSTVSRRTASVSYSAIVTAEKASDAETNAQALQSQPELLVAGIMRAKAATGKESVSVPGAGAAAVSVQAPTIQTGSDTAGAQQPGAAPTSDDSGPLSAGAVVGIAVGVIAAVGFIIAA